jgi:Outer membrane protein beta-barrel domain
MKKVNLLILFIFISSFGMTQSLSIGAKAGLNFNSFTNLPSDGGGVSYSNNGLGTGFLVGGFIRIGLGGFYLQPELVYTQRTGRLSTKFLGLTTNSTTTVGYIDIPVLFGRSFIGGKLRVNLGPVASLPVNSKVEVDGGSGSTSVSDLQSPQFGYQVGVGTDLGKFTIDLRYEGYLSNISTRSSSPRYSGFQLSLGYKFLDK